MMEQAGEGMDYTALGIGLVIGIGVGIAGILFRNHLQTKGPELLTRGRLKDYNLPSEKFYSHIFQKPKEKRIEMAKERLVEVTKLLANIDSSLELHMEEIDDYRRDLNIAQDNIENMETEGEKQVSAQANIMPVMHKFSASLSAISDDMKSFWSYFSQKRFLTQVERGHDRKTVDEIMRSEFDDIKTRSQQALNKAMGALEISSKDYNKVNELWLK